MRRIEDLRSLCLVLSILALQVLTLFYSAHWNRAVVIALFIANLFGVFILSLINHNHRHCPIFESHLLNRWLNVLLSLGMLAPSTRLHAVHVLNHHSHFDTDKDWASYKILDPSSKGFRRSCEYLFRACKTMQSQRQTLKLNSEMKASMKAERRILFAYVFLGLILVPKMFLFWLMPSCTLGLLLLLLANLINHDQCDLQSELEHSRNFISPIENFFFCNNGFHTVHHLRPSMHWSDYPRWHQEELASKISSKNQRPSFLLHLAGNYIFHLSTIIKN